MKLNLKSEGGGWFVSGFASAFGIPDQVRDVVVPGAFFRSLRTRGAGEVRMLFQHDPAQPIGRWDVVREEARGLYVEGRLAAGSSRAAEVASLLRAGAIDGLSIGFRTVRAQRDAKAGTRRLLEVDLWEVSIVTFPMQPLARARLREGPVQHRMAQRGSQAIARPVGAPLAHFDGAPLAHFHGAPLARQMRAAAHRLLA